MKAGPVFVDRLPPARPEDPMMSEVRSQPGVWGIVGEFKNRHEAESKSRRWRRHGFNVAVRGGTLYARWPEGGHDAETGS